MNSSNSGQSNGETNSDSSSDQGDSDSDGDQGDGDDSDFSMSRIQLLEAEGLDATLIPASEGGTGAVATGMNPAINSWRSNSIMGVMEKLNAIDSIDTIYGLYSYDTNIVTGVRTNFQPLTTYNDALSFETDSSEDMTTTLDTAAPYNGGSTIDLVDKTHYNVAQ